MKRKLFFLIRCVAGAVWICSALSQVRAQTEQAAGTVVVQLSSGQSVTVLNLSDEVGLLPNETVNITVQLSADEAGQTISIEPLDGGSIVGGNGSAAVGEDGSLHLGFKAGGSPGHYQVALHNNAREIGVHFWVFDLTNPQNNPPVLVPTANP